MAQWGDKDDSTLLGAVKNGAESAFDELYIRWFERLARFAYTFVLAPDIADEIVQDVFLSLWERRKDIEIRESVSVYLYTAVRNRALKELRRRGIAERAESLIESGAFTVSAQIPELPDEATASSYIQSRIEELLASMPPRRREAMLLRWKHGLSFAEIGQVMGISEDAARMHVTRVQQALEHISVILRNGGV